MLRMCWGRAALVALIVGVVAGSALPAAAQSAGSTTIVAKIAPVRYALVNDSGVIQQIDSNTSEDVPPKVYQGSFSSQPITLSPEISHQYNEIIQLTDTRQTGTIYRAAHGSQDHGRMSYLQHIIQYRSLWLTIDF